MFGLFLLYETSSLLLFLRHRKKNNTASVWVHADAALLLPADKNEAAAQIVGASWHKRAGKAEWSSRTTALFLLSSPGNGPPGINEAGRRTMTLRPSKHPGIISLKEEKDLYRSTVTFFFMWDSWGAAAPHPCLRTSSDFHDLKGGLCRFTEQTEGLLVVRAARRSISVRSHGSHHTWLFFWRDAAHAGAWDEHPHGGAD